MLIRAWAQRFGRNNIASDSPNYLFGITIVLGIMINKFLVSESRYFLGLSSFPSVIGALEPRRQLATILLEQSLLGLALEYSMSVRSTVKSNFKLGKISSLCLPLFFSSPLLEVGS